MNLLEKLSTNVTFYQLCSSCFNSLNIIKLNLKVQNHDYILLSLVVMLSCNNINKKVEKTILDTKSQSPISLDSFIKSYIYSLDTETIKLIDSTKCENYSDFVEDYYNGIYFYTPNKIEKVSGDINSDGHLDYIIQYEAVNCWGGNGADNYLSNIFFLYRNDKGYKVDENASNLFKKAFIQNIKYNNIETNIEKFINGVKFVEIKNGIGFGNFSIFGYHDFEYVSGNFEYDFNLNNLIFK